MVATTTTKHRVGPASSKWSGGKLILSLLSVFLVVNGFGALFNWTNSDRLYLEALVSMHAVVGQHVSTQLEDCSRSGTTLDSCVGIERILQNADLDLTRAVVKNAYGLQPDRLKRERVHCGSGRPHPPQY
jgi:hypothetical protein